MHVTGTIDGEDPVLFADYEAICSIPRYAIIDDVRHAQYANYHDTWLSDSLPACKDLTSVREPVETE